MSEFDIHLDRDTGKCRVVVDGVDLVGLMPVHSVDVHYDVHGAPMVMLTAPASSVRVTSDDGSVVRNVSDDELRHMLAEIVDSLDSDEIARSALAGGGGLSADPARSMLEAIRDAVLSDA